MSNPTPTQADSPINCPHCKVSLLGTPIPEEYLEHYAGRYYKREIGVEYPEVYDGVHHFQCPDCHGVWGGYAVLKADPKV